MTDKVYPEWQKEIRKAQSEWVANRNREYEESYKKAQQAEQKLLDKNWNDAQSRFAEIGFTAYPLARPTDNKWQIDNYIFEVTRHLTIKRIVPAPDGYNEVAEEIDEFMWGRFNEDVSESKWISPALTLTDIAFMIDKVDALYQHAVDNNHSMFEESKQRMATFEMNRQKQQIETPEIETLSSLGERLETLIREIVSEELYNAGIEY